MKSRRPDACEKSTAKAVAILAAFFGPSTTAIGATGFAGLISALPGSPLAQELGIDRNNRILLVATLDAITGARGAWAANLARHLAQRCQVDLGGNDIDFTSLEADAFQLTITRWKSMLDAIRHARINNR